MRITAPYVIIAANLILMLVSLAGIIRTAQGQAGGHDLIVIALNGTIFYSAAVEYIERGNRTPDERQSAIRGKSLAIAGWIVISLVMIWAVLLGQFAKNGLWFPKHPGQ
jgi:hypothetical protein